MLVDHLCGSLAVLVHHTVDSVSYVSEVQSTFVRLTTTGALELNAAADAEDELPCPPAIAFYLSTSRSVPRPSTRRRV